MSVPVLSQLFNALRKGHTPKGASVLNISTASSRGVRAASPEGKLAQRQTSGLHRASEETPRPSPQSQSFSRSYGSILPTSLTYVILLARGFSPWRPAADMGTVWHENHTVSLGFSRADESAPDTARAAVLYGNNVPISGQTDSRESVPYKEKRTLPGTLADVA